MSIFDYFEKRRVTRTLENQLSPRVIRLIEEGSDQDALAAPVPRHLQFVIAQIENDDPLEARATVGRVIETGFRHNATLFTPSPYLVTLCLGTPTLEYDSAEKRLALVSDLFNENKGAIKIAHGECDALVGNLGGNSGRCIWEPIIPGLNAMLAKLLNEPKGAVVEFESQVK